jgi:hypothetical protein
MPLVALLLSLLLVTGCAVHPPPNAEVGPLLPSLQVTEVGDSVHFVFQVTNTSTEPVELHFRTGQSFDFLAMDGGREVWRWSADRMFTQALRQERLDGGATLRFEASWLPPADLRGDLLAIARLTAWNVPVEQQANIRLQ